AGRLRYSPDSYGNSGPSWNKRALVAVPLPFLKVSEDIAFKLYGTLGNIWVDRYLEFGIPSADYWYWQVGLVTSAYGLDFTAAFTDTSIEPSGCAHTRYCAARFFVSLTKVFQPAPSARRDEDGVGPAQRPRAVEHMMQVEQAVQ